MNNKFKEEFKNLDSQQLVDLLNRFVGHNFLETDLHNSFNKECDKNRVYLAKYNFDKKYGYWIVGWGTGFQKLFKNYIKIQPFKISFDITDEKIDPFNANKRKSELEQYIYILLYKNCPHYKDAILDEAQSFIDFLEYGSDEKDSLTK